MQIGTTYNYSVPSTYVYGGIWRVLVGSNNGSHTITPNNNEIIIVYTAQISTSPIVINYIDNDNHSVILRSIEVGSRAVGTEYTSISPSSIDVNGVWSLVGSGTISHLVTDNSNTISVYYEKLISNTDVTIKYVEHEDHNNIIATMNMGAMQVGWTYNFSVSSTFDHGGIWTLLGPTSRTFIITEENNEILIEYIPPKDLVVPITIKYVDKNNYDNIFDTVVVNNVPITKFENEEPIKDIYTYSVPSNITSNGLWRIADIDSNRTYIVKNSNNIIYVEYEKIIIEDITIQYIDIDDKRILNEIKIKEEYQAGTTYEYSVPEIIDDNGKWLLIGSQNRTKTIVEEGQNTIEVYYEKMLTTDNVIIRYVEKNNHSNILQSVNAGTRQVSSTYQYEPPITIDDTGEWSIYGPTGIRSYIVINTDINIIYVEYEKVMSDTITIKYIDSTNSSVVLYSTTASPCQVGTVYNFTVQSTYTNETGIWTLSGSTSRSSIITAGNNIIEVPYIKPIMTAPVVVKYMSDDSTPILLNTAFEGTKEVGSIYTHTAPSTYNNNGQWNRVGSENKSISIVNGTNEMIITYTRIWSTDEVTIQFVDTDLMAIYPTNILTSSNAGYKQVGSTFTYTPPTTYIDEEGRGWQLVTTSPINYTILQDNNNLIVQYRLVSKPLSFDEVTIKYVEQGNTTNVLKTTIEGQIEIDTVYQHIADSSFTNAQGTWNIEGTTSITHTVTPNGNTILVPYTRTQSSTYVTITYVNQDDNKEILYEEIAKTLLYVGQTHSYTVPGSFPDESGGLWAPVNIESGIYNHLVTKSNNNIIIPCKKLITDVTINYIDYENAQNIIYTETISVQIGTSYTYEYIQEEYIDVETGEHWSPIPNQYLSIVVDANSQNNVINALYLKQEVLINTKVSVKGKWIITNDFAEVIVVITNLTTGKRYHGILKDGEEEISIFKYLPLGTYSISCIEQLDSQYVNSNVGGNTFVLTETDNEIEIEVTNKKVYLKGFYSLDSANNPLKVYIESEEGDKNGI